MTNVELDVLEAVAKAATPHLTVLLPPSLYEDSWHVSDVDDTAVVRCYGFANEGNGDTARCLAEYIAAANPSAVLDLITELRQARLERDWLAVNLANGLVDPGFIEHLAELGGMSPPDPATLIEAAKEATCQKN